VTRTPGNGAKQPSADDGPTGRDLRQISHDLHNRIAVVAGLASLLADDADAGPDAALGERLRRLRSSAVAASELLAEWAAAAAGALVPLADTPAPGRGGDPSPAVVAGVGGFPAARGRDGEGPVSILVVDDDPDQRAVMRARLTEAGYEVREAATGESALDQIGGADLVVLDYQLPGVSGIDVLRNVVAFGGPPVVIVTGSGSETAAVEAMKAGALDYVAKAGDYARSLPRVVDRALGQHQLARRAEQLARDLAEARDQRAEDAERERRALAEAQRVAQLGSWEWDVVANVVTWSDELYRLYGLDPATFPASYGGYMDRVHAEDRAAAGAAIRHASETLEPFDFEHRILLADGGVRWLRCRGQAIGDAAGAPVRMHGTAQDVTDRKQAEATLAHQAQHDGLTGLPNRTMLEDRLSQALGRSRRSAGGVAVLFLDVDRFKVINDARGHSVGDLLLQAVAARLRATVRPADTVARFGGDEFVIVIEGTDADAVADLVERIGGVLRPPIALHESEISVTVSIGVALEGPGDGVESLIRDADAAMYLAKEQGRDRCVVFDAPMRTRAIQRVDTEHGLRQAIDQGGLRVHYQPVVELTGGLVVGVEALVRWQHPERGMLYPDDFIPLAEETGLIVAVGGAVLTEACAEVAGWNRRGGAHPALSVAVNVSARQLRTPGLETAVQEALAASGLDPSLLCLEITESILLDDAESSSRILRGLKALGVRLGVDDFGTGYSSLSYLKRFPIDTLKIDRSFVASLGDGHRPADRAIVAGSIDLAHAFGLTTVAEGVETAEQLAVLRTLGCEQAQGYGLAKPMTGLETVRITTAWEPLFESTPRPSPGVSDKGVKRVLIVDDDALLRSVIRLALTERGGFEIVGESADGREAVGLARHSQPDLVLLDLAMPGMGGLEALPLIRAVAPKAEVVILSALEPSEIAEKARAQGAFGYLSKSDPGALVDDLHRLLDTPA